MAVPTYGWARASSVGNLQGMYKHIVATGLWFLVGWTAGSMATFFLDVPAGLNAVGALTFAAFVWFDPGGRLWTSSSKGPRRVDAKAAAPAAFLATE
jgi:hypothetical protein